MWVPPGGETASLVHLRRRTRGQPAAPPIYSCRPGAVPGLTGLRGAMRPTNRFLSSIALAALLLVGGAAAAAPTSEPGAWLRLRDQRILELRSARGELPAGQRARDATSPLKTSIDSL